MDEISRNVGREARDKSQPLSASRELVPARSNARVWTRSGSKCHLSMLTETRQLQIPGWPPPVVPRFERVKWKAVRRRHVRGSGYDLKQLAFPWAERSRPKHRYECKNGIRPCPYVSCRHHLLLESNEHGSLRLNIHRRSRGEEKRSIPRSLGLRQVKVSERWMDQAIPGRGQSRTASPERRRRDQDFDRWRSETGDDRALARTSGRRLYPRFG